MTPTRKRLAGILDHNVWKNTSFYYLTEENDLTHTPTFSRAWWSSIALSRRSFLLLIVELISSHAPRSSLHLGLMESSA